MPIPPPNERPTAQQLANQSMGGSGCPVCGCNDWRTLDTRYNAAGNKARTLYCRHCGREGPRKYTEEVTYKMRTLE
jgi:hypothetical protein